MKTATAGMPRKRFRGSMHDELTAALRTMIVRHELPPGEWIAEAQLSEALGVSRTPLREALKTLAAEKLVVLHPYRGAAVTELSPDLVDKLFEAQSIVEGQAMRLACVRATDAEIAAFAKQHVRMVRFFQRGDRKAYFALNQELHRAVVAMSHNPVLVETHAVIMVQIERARFAALGVDHRWQDSVSQHEALLEALTARDADRAGDLMARHVAETGATVRRSLAAQLASPRPAPPRRAERAGS